MMMMMMINPTMYVLLLFVAVYLCCSFLITLCSCAADSKLAFHVFNLVD